MKQLSRKLTLTALSLALCSGAWAQQVLQPAENCRDHSAADSVSFADAVLENEVRAALSLGPEDALTCGLAMQLTMLDASGAGARRSVSGSPEWNDPEHLFHDLSGIQNLTGLTDLALRNRGLSDISPLAKLTKLEDLNIHTQYISDLTPLSGLTSLIELRLAANSFIDLSPLRGLTSLQYLELTGNDITDITPLSGLTNLTQLDLRFSPELTIIQALFENPGIGAGDIVKLRHTNVSCADQARLAWVISVLIASHNKLASVG